MRFLRVQAPKNPLVLDLVSRPKGCFGGRNYLTRRRNGGKLGVSHRANTIVLEYKHTLIQEVFIIVVRGQQPRKGA